MQFKIITGTKYEDLGERGRRFFSDTKSYQLLHMVFIENRIKFSKSLDEGETFNTYSEHISFLASLPV